MTIALMIAVAVGLTIVLAVVRLRQDAATVAALHAAAIDQLWKRYNLTSDLLSWATHDGGPDAADRLNDVAAAREEIMKTKASEPLRLQAEDKLQSALNAFYRAAETDEDLISSHEIVMIIAHLTLADAGVVEKITAHNTAAEAFNRRISGRPMRVLARAAGIEGAPPMSLSVAPEREARPPQFFATESADSPATAS